MANTHKTLIVGSSSFLCEFTLFLQNRIRIINCAQRSNTDIGIKGKGYIIMRKVLTNPYYLTNGRIIIYNIPFTLVC